MQSGIYSHRLLFFLTFAIFISTVASAGRAEPLHFADLRHLVETHKLTSVAELLPLLPESYRSQYVLIHNSRSLHEASWENPRVLLFGADAHLIVSFNGTAAQRGFRGLETMEFDEGQKSFVYREIEFPEKSGEDLKISADNPTRCLTCHGNPARPIWDPAPLWPGVYGERYLQPLAEEEKNGLQKFLAGQKQNPRYRFLLNTQALTEASAFSPLKREQYSQIQNEPANQRLSGLLNELNLQQIVRLISSSPQFAEFRYAVLAAVDPRCETFGKANSAGEQPDLEKSLHERLAQYQKDNRDFEEMRLHRLSSSNAAVVAHTPPMSEQELFSPLRFVLEEKLHLPISSLTSSLERESFVLQEPNLTLKKLRQRITSLIQGQDPQLVTLASASEVGALSPYCRYLQTQINQSVPSNEVRGTQQSVAKRGPLLQRCQSCHQGSVGPNIPFDNPIALAQLLDQPNSTRYPRGTLRQEILFRLSPAAGARRMPLGFLISDQERAELHNYFAKKPFRSSAISERE